METNREELKKKEDDYQVVVKVDENVVIEDVQKGWGPAVDPA